VPIEKRLAKLLFQATDALGKGRWRELNLGRCRAKGRQTARRFKAAQGVNVWQWNSGHPKLRIPKNRTSRSKAPPQGIRATV
jgi:hypothetical protein